MAGYSGTPLVKKLGIHAGARVALIDAPADFATTLGPLPHEVTLLAELPGPDPLDVILFFTSSLADLRAQFSTLMQRLQPAGGLWVAWPKKASRVPTDLTEDRVREVALAHGLVDNKVCAIDDVWSGLRLVYRVQDRPKKRGR